MLSTILVGMTPAIRQKAIRLNGYENKTKKKRDSSSMWSIDIKENIYFIIQRYRHHKRFIAFLSSCNSINLESVKNAEK